MNDINVKADLSHCATKTDLTNATGEDKLKTVPVDLARLRSAVNNHVVKKTMYNKLVAKVNNIDTCGFILKTKYDTNKSDLEKKISDADKKFLIIMLKLLK